MLACVRHVLERGHCVRIARGQLRRRAAAAAVPVTADLPGTLPKHKTQRVATRRRRQSIHAHQTAANTRNRFIPGIPGCPFGCVHIDTHTHTYAYSIYPYTRIESGRIVEYIDPVWRHRLKREPERARLGWHCSGSPKSSMYSPGCLARTRYITHTRSLCHVAAGRAAKPGKRSPCNRKCAHNM